MLIPNILNIAINLFFVYFIVSLLLSALQEQIVVLLALRAKNLKSSIETLLGDKDQKTKLLTDKLYQYPLIKTLNQQGNKWLKRYFKKWDSIGPSYLRSQTFSDALLELLRQDYDLDFETYSNKLDGMISQLKAEMKRRQRSNTIPINWLLLLKYNCIAGILFLRNSHNGTSRLSKLPNELLENLYALARQSQNRVNQGEATLKQFQENIANWFDESMERATGVYKRNAFGLSLLLGFIIAVIGNIDTIHIINQLYNDPALSETLSNFVTQEVNTIESQCQDKSEEDKSNCIQEKFNEINVNDIRSFPIGWEVQHKNQADKSNFFNYNINLKQQQSFLFTIFGWLITAFALAQGAPFWFDLLNNVINIRSSGKRYDSTKDEQKKQK